MKKIFSYTLLIALSLTALYNNSLEATKIGVVYTERCFNEAKFVIQERESLENKQASVAAQSQEKQKELDELIQKFNDVDHRDSLSPEGEEQMMRRRQELEQEIMEFQNQGYQALEQLFYQFQYKASEMISNASKIVGKEENYDLILNDRNLFFAVESFDITSKVIDEMNKLYESEKKASH